MDYLEHVLGIHTAYNAVPLKPLPNYIYARYRIQRADLNGQDVIFLYPLGELEAVESIKKHIERVKKTEGVPVVLLPERLTYRQKEYLIRDRIPFIVEGKQIYLPFMGTYLQERGDGEPREAAKILPSAQVLLLYYIYHGCGELLTSRASRDLGYTPTSISRAAGQLKEKGLIRIESRGVQRIVVSDKGPEELFHAAENDLLSPVKRKIYVPRKEITKKLYMSGYSALSEYTMLNSPATVTFAAGSITEWEQISSKRLESTSEECEVELWRYDPGKLSDGKCVDRLSLALALHEDKDERTEEAVEEMLKDVWGNIDGKRN